MCQTSIYPPQVGCQHEWTVARARSLEELVGCLSVRLRVFVLEQKVPLIEEVDEHDAAAMHYMAVVEGHVIGAARLVVQRDGTGKIGRVAVLPEHRSRGVGGSLIQHILDHEAAPLRMVVLDAQVSAIPFYERFGFTAAGDVFLDAGIPHRRMWRSAAGERQGAP